MAAEPGGMRAFPLEARGSAENSRLENEKILASRMTSFAFVVRDGAFAPFPAHFGRQAG